MTDTRTPEQRRRIMAAVGSRNTTPEIRLRKALYAAGMRGWRCNYRRVPGTPDVAWLGLRVAVFVDGAFWHGHSSRHRPGRSGDYWDKKIARNVQRDRQVEHQLDALGWAVERVWDFEVRHDLDAVVERVTELVRSRRRTTRNRLEKGKATARSDAQRGDPAALPPLIKSAPAVDDQEMQPRISWPASTSAHAD